MHIKRSVSYSLSQGFIARQRNSKTTYKLLVLGSYTSVDSFMTKSMLLAALSIMYLWNNLVKYCILYIKNSLK